MAVPWQLLLAHVLLLEASGCAFAAIRDDGSVITWGDEAWNLEFLLPGFRVYGLGFRVTSQSTLFMNLDPGTRTTRMPRCQS